MAGFDQLRDMAGRDLMGRRNVRDDMGRETEPDRGERLRAESLAEQRRRAAHYSRQAQMARRLAARLRGRKK